MPQMIGVFSVSFLYAFQRSVPALRAAWAS